LYNLVLKHPQKNEAENRNILSVNQENTPGGKSINSLGILLIGYGGPGHQGGFLADAIQVLYFDFDKNKSFLISIPRDLWLKLPNGKETKINSILASSGSKNDLIKTGAQDMKYIISNITKLPIDYYIAVDFVGFERIIGINLKGIDVQVSETLNDPWYPIRGEELNTCGLTSQDIASLSAKFSGFDLEKQFPCRYRHLHFEKGLVNMHGGDALAYVRSRHGSSEGDISRGKRQQEVLAALGKKLLSLDILNQLDNIYESISKNISTDLNFEIAKHTVPLIKNLENIEVQKINLSTSNVLSVSNINGASVVIPKEGLNKWGNLQNFIGGEISSSD
jgi:anionic cell wall polymer biosynthesis LytR-Cps2A-Psr (LCP) family protein